MLVIYACNKTDTETKFPPTQTSSSRVSQAPIVENGILVFENEESFEKTLTELEDKDTNLESWINNLDFKSARNLSLEQVPEQVRDTFEFPMDEILMSALNKDNIVRVRPWIFRLNPRNRKVYVLNENKLEKTRLLQLENPPTNDSDIEEFSFDDDVFTMLASPLGSSTAERCECGSTIESRSNANAVVYCFFNPANDKDWFETKHHLNYNGWGIWKTLYVHWWHYKTNAQSLTGIDVDVCIFPTYSWEKCNGDTKSVTTLITPTSFLPNGAIDPANADFCNGRKHQWNLYRGTKCLKTFSASVNLMQQNGCSLIQNITLQLPITLVPFDLGTITN